MRSLVPSYSQKWVFLDCAMLSLDAQSTVTLSAPSTCLFLLSNLHTYIFPPCKISYKPKISLSLSLPFYLSITLYTLPSPSVSLSLYRCICTLYGRATWPCHVTAPGVIFVSSIFRQFNRQHVLHVLCYMLCTHRPNHL